MASTVTPTIIASPILFEPGGNTRQIVDKWFARSGAMLRQIMSLGSVEAIKELVRAGLGCAVLPRMAIPADPDRTDLVVHDLAPALHRSLALVVRRDKTLTRGLKETISAIESLSASLHA